jgi:choline dehydrogenase-like flavoprotein
MIIEKLFSFAYHLRSQGGADPQNAVVDGNQEVHSVKGLLVCDGSVFPAASGVNPMLSIMGLAHKASQYIKTTI